MDIRKTVLVYQYSERIKSELIIALKLMTRLASISGTELQGAEKLMASYLESVVAEIRMARNIEESEPVLKAEKKTSEAREKLVFFTHEEATQRLREALVAITTSCQRAMEALEKKNIL
ncbi:MAG: hypothetical protein ACE5LV_05205 [Candidatus Aminicenantales bacterium]